MNCRVVISVFAICLMALAATAQADVSIEMVTVGDAGNALDYQYESIDPGWNYGAVDHEFQIGKYELTYAEFVPFLNAKATLAGSSALQYHTGIANVTQTGSGTIADPYAYTVNAGYENRPADSVCAWQIMQYCNWLTNGQGDCNIDSGAYTGIGNISTFARDTGVGTKFYLPTSNEWYKAAYYDPTLNSGAGGYWQYPNMSNTQMTGAEANIDFAYGFATIDVGSFPTQLSYYGTLDQGGNASEATETAAVRAGTPWYESWGGNYLFGPEYTWGDYNNVIDLGSHYGSTQGFRIVSVTNAVPEPSTVLLTVMGLVGLMAYAWKKRK